MTLPSNDPADAATTAGWLAREHADRRRFEPFAAARGIVTLAGAYDVQHAFVEQRAAQRHAVRAGHKIGLTSAAMQRMCGIDSPVAGVVLGDAVHASGARVRRRDFVHIGIECEIAVRLGRDLPPNGGPSTLADVQAVVDAVAPAIEIVDDRSCDYARLDVLSLVGDNAWNAGIVLGEFSASWPDLAEVEGRLFVDGGVLDRGRGSDVLGHPLRSVVWLANHLADRHDHLRAGDIVMTGSLVTTKFPDRAGRYRFEASGLGAVELTVDD